MSDNLAFALFCGAVLLFCGGLFALGRWLSKRIARDNRSALNTVSITAAGYVLVASQVLLMVAVCVLYNLFPESKFSQWLSTPTGLTKALLALIVVCGIVGGLLGLRGIKLLKIRPVTPEKSKET